MERHCHVDNCWTDAFPMFTYDATQAGASDRDVKKHMDHINEIIEKE
jgi:hypothetical protein